MKIEKYLLLLFLILLNGCLEIGISNIESEIIKLETDDDKKQYLEKILEEDQKVRGSKGQELMLKHGEDSKEYMDYVKIQSTMDETNLMKVEKYLEIHGYPDKILGEYATTAPWMVIHHAQGYDARDRNFETVYEAYLTGDIDDGAVSFYLGRMYNIKYGKSFSMESPFKAEDEINRLIIELNLEEKQANVHQRLNQSNTLKP